jgi:hypothetical protein
MQKLSLKVWNECCQVFLKKDNENDLKETRKQFGLSSNILIKSTRDFDPTVLTKGELDHARSLFVMTKFDIQLDDVKEAEPNKN